MSSTDRIFGHADERPRSHGADEPGLFARQSGIPLPPSPSSLSAQKVENVSCRKNRPLTFSYGEPLPTPCQLSRQSGSPAVRQSGSPAVRQSGSPAVRQSGRFCAGPLNVNLALARSAFLPRRLNVVAPTLSGSRSCPAFPEVRDPSFEAWAKKDGHDRSSSVRRPNSCRRAARLLVAIPAPRPCFADLT